MHIHINNSQSILISQLENVQSCNQFSTQTHYISSLLGGNDGVALQIVKALQQNQNHPIFGSEALVTVLTLSHCWQHSPILGNDGEAPQIFRVLQANGLIFVPLFSLF